MRRLKTKTTPNSSKKAKSKMADSYTGVFGTYPTMVGVVNATGKTEIAAAVVILRALFNPSAGQAASHTDFSHISPGTRERINKEIDALAAMIAASPSS